MGFSLLWLRDLNFVLGHSVFKRLLLRNGVFTPYTPTSSALEEGLLRDLGIEKDSTMATRHGLEP